MTSKVLVIEDSDALRKDITEMLSFEGFDVQEAANGRIGVQMAREYNPNLIICDIMMPELDGYGVLAELQKDGAGITIPFIFLTAKTDKVDIRTGMSAGADDYVTKPFTVDELIASVRRRLKKAEDVVKIADERLDHLRDNIILSLPHELRTPLTGILGFSDILMTDCNVMGPDKISEMAKYIYDAAQRLYRLTENYLLFAQLELMAADPVRIKNLREATTTGPRAIIEDAAIQKAHQYNRGEDLSLSVSDDAVIQIIEDSLKKIVEEIVDNAFKFSLPGKVVELKCETFNDQYRITVVDEGRGLTSQQLSELGVFMQFERKVYEQQGSGFGLMIVKKSVEIFGGEFQIESVAQQHTVVTVSIPIAQVDEANAMPI